MHLRKKFILLFLDGLSYSYQLGLSHSVQFSSVQPLSHVQLFAAPCPAARQASLSIANSRSPPKFMSIESVMPSNHLTLCRSLLLLPSTFPSIRFFSNEPALCIRWPKYWSFSFNIRPSSEYPGRVSFRMDCLDLLAVQATLKSLLQQHSSKASIPLCSAFFTVHLGCSFFFFFFFPLIPLRIPCHSLWTCRGSAKDQVLTLCVFPCMILIDFPLLLLICVSFCLIFKI